jgi:predicted DNA-binding transcriptional regulator YafY
MYDESPNRFDRIVAILIQLQSRKIVRAQDLADRFDVSLRTIYRDIRTLESSGVPIYSEAGIGYSLVDGYRLPPVMFTREEASSFIAAEKLMQQFPDKELGEHHTSAMYKLKAVLKSADKDLVADIENKVLMRNPTVQFNKNAPNALAQIFRSIGEKKQVMLLYEAIAANEPTERIIEPVGVFHENQNWYIFGYCHLRKDYRQFRTDRVHDIKLTEIPFKISHDALENFLNKTKTEDFTEIKIVVDKYVAKYLKYDRKHHGFISEKEVGDYMEMTFLSRDIDNGFARWFMMFPDHATIIEPESLKTRIAELLQAGLEKLKK